MPTIDKTKVLIVDDEHAIANSLAFILDLQGFMTRTAYSGEEGIELAYYVSTGYLGLGCFYERNDRT
jgi:DNA-binding NtrC family response regulator